MTINHLQESLVRSIEELLAGIYYINYKKESQSMRGYIQAVPIRLAETSSYYDQEEADQEPPLFPYFVVRLSEGGMDFNGGDAKLLILFALYDNDVKQRGYYSLISTIQKVMNHFTRNPVLGVYWCEKKMELAVQDDNTHPYYFGGLEMTWNLPVLEMEEME